MPNQVFAAMQITLSHLKEHKMYFSEISTKVVPYNFYKNIYYKNLV